MPRPSYRHGYAKSAAESAYPNLWRGLVGAWVPGLGQSGDLRNVAGVPAADATLQANTVWEANSIRQPATTDNMFCDGFINKDISGEFTVIQFIKPDAWQFYYALTITKNTADQEDLLSFGAANINANLRVVVQVDWGATTLDNNNSVVAGEWNQFVARRDSSDLVEVFSNGNKLANSGTRAGTFQWNNGEFRTSTQSDVNAQPGNYGSILFYDRALSDSEIRFLYYNELAPFRRRSRIVGATAAAPPAADRTQQIIQMVA